MQRTLSWTARVTAVVLLTCAWLAAAAGGAEAHASLVSSSPADGAMVAPAPDAIILRFDEPVDVRATAVRIFSGSGSTIRLEAAQAVGDPDAAVASDVRVALPALLTTSTSCVGARRRATTSTRCRAPSPSVSGSPFNPASPPRAAPVHRGGRASRRCCGCWPSSGSPGPWAVRSCWCRLDPVLADRDGSGAQLRVGRVARPPWARSAWSQPRPGAARAGGQPAFRHVVVAWLAAVGGLLSSGGPRAVGDPRSRWPGRPHRVGWLGLVAAGWGIAALGHGAGRPTAGVPGSVVATTHVLATCTWLGGAVLLIRAGGVGSSVRGDPTWVRSSTRSPSPLLRLQLSLVSVVTGLLLASVLVPSAGALTDSGTGGCCSPSWSSSASPRPREPSPTGRSARPRAT